MQKVFQRALLLSCFGALISPWGYKLLRLKALVKPLMSGSLRFVSKLG